MSQAIIAANKPIEVALKKDQKMAWCTCGRSKDQPYCDGSHRGTDFKPLMFTPPADGVALANSAIQAVGCVGARICHTNNCPAGVATQREALRARLNVSQSAEQLARFLSTSTHLMQVMARACGHRSLSDFDLDDLSTWSTSIAQLTGVSFAGVSAAE